MSLVIQKSQKNEKNLTGLLSSLTILDKNKLKMQKEKKCDFNL